MYFQYYNVIFSPPHKPLKLVSCHFHVIFLNGRKIFFLENSINNQLKLSFGVPLQHLMNNKT